MSRLTGGEIGSRRIVALVVTGLIVAAAAFSLHVARSHYRAVMHEFDRWRTPELLDHPERIGIAGLHEVRFESRDKIRLAAWYVPSRNRAAVVLTHGTNADRCSLLSELRILTERGFGVLALDWPGHGNSDGEVRFDRHERDALVATLDWLSAREDVDPQRIGAFGFSIGGYLTAQVASYDQRIRAVVLAGTPSSFIEYIDIAHSKWGALSRLPAHIALRQSGMPQGELEPENVVAAISPRPILFVAGAVDTMVPPAMAQRLYSRAGEPKEIWIVPNAAHGGYAQASRQEYPAQIAQFFSQQLLN